MFAAREAGNETKWSCEIDAYCRLVLKSRFPDVKQYGDIRGQTVCCKLNGGEIEPVDVVTFGSPCQSFSQAGARKGLEGASGLFYEATAERLSYAPYGGSRKVAQCWLNYRVSGLSAVGAPTKSDFREVLN